MTTYEKLKEIIVKAVPEIMELKFGCEIVLLAETESFYLNGWRKIASVVWDGNKVCEFKDTEGNRHKVGTIAEILGRDITLEDVLRAIKLKGEDALVDQYGDFCMGYADDNSMICNWQLGKPLHQQSEETQQFLLDLLK